MVGREEGYENYLQGVYIGGGGIKRFSFFHFETNLNLLGELWGFPSNALGTHMFNFETLDFNCQFFAYSNIKYIFYLSCSGEKSQTP